MVKWKYQKVWIDVLTFRMDILLDIEHINKKDKEAILDYYEIDEGWITWKT